MKDWGAHTSLEEVRRRSGGRNHYNAWRRIVACNRRVELSELLTKYGLARGSQARIARELRCSEATISRDVAILLYSGSVCPTCGSYRPGKCGWRPIKTGRRSAA